MEIAIIVVNWSRFHRFDYLPLLLLSFFIPHVALFKVFITLLLRSPGLSLAFRQQIIHELGISSSVLGGLPRLKANVNSLSSVILTT